MTLFSLYLAWDKAKAEGFDGLAAALETLIRAELGAN